MSRLSDLGDFTSYATGNDLEKRLRIFFGDVSTKFSVTQPSPLPKAARELLIIELH